MVPAWLRKNPSDGNPSSESQSAVRLAKLLFAAMETARSARTVKDVSPHEFVKAYAAHLKRSGKVPLFASLLLPFLGCECLRSFLSSQNVICPYLIGFSSQYLR